MAIKKSLTTPAPKVAKKAVKKPSVKKTTAVKKAAPMKAVIKKVAAVKKATVVKTAVKKPKITVKKKVIAIVGSSVPIDTPVPFKEVDFVDRVRELPERYSDTRLSIVVRDPQWCFAYWDISDDDYAKHTLASRALHLKIFRLLSPDNIEHKFQHMDIEVNRHYGSWYIMLGMPDNYFMGEVGYYDENGVFVTLVRSRVVRAPRDTFSPVIDEEWMLTDEMARELYGELDITGLSSASMINIFKKYLAGGASSFMLSGASSSDSLLKKK
ncbi:MAG: DUF4912 domain-containing protein [Spirochaetes bacterium]|nr:DUF4912 domain-containing protein [Spirochaetota bacterium]